jgi:hypothetical protein
MTTLEPEGFLYPLTSRDVIDHVIVLNERHLRRVLQSYMA